jgi:thiol-disulfide isomerase/thioredoxin
MKKIIFTIIVITLIVLAAKFYNSKVDKIEMDINNQDNTSKMNISDYDITLKNLVGDSVDINDYKGKIIILNFWASWCSPCKLELPDFDEVNKEIDKDNVQIFMINLTDGIREKKDNIISFIENKGYSFDVLFDKGLKIADKLDVQLYPTTFIFDKDGNLFKKIIGITNKDDLKEYIKEINK